MTRLPDLLRRLADDPRPDGELLAAFRLHRDEAAFAAVVRRHGGLVWGVCRRSLPDPADAEDAFQAAFLVLVRRSGRLSHAATVGPWLHRTAVLVCRNARRKNARRLCRTAPLPPDLPAPSPPPAPDLDALLLALPERDRSAVVLCGLQGLTRKEAADRLGVPEGTVSARLSRGLAKLRRRYAGGLPALVVAPTALSESAVRSAAADRLAAVSPGVLHLAEGVLRMFWLKRVIPAAGVAALLAGVVGMAWLTPAAPPALAAAPVPAAAEPTDPISRLVRLEAEADRAGESPGLAARRKELLTAIDRKTSVGGMMLAAVRKGPGGPLVTVFEYDEHGRRAAQATGTVGFLARHLERLTRAYQMDQAEQKYTTPRPYALALYVDPATPDAAVPELFTALKAGGWPAPRVTLSLPAKADLAEQEKRLVGDRIHYRNGRVYYEAVWVDLIRLDPNGLPSVVIDYRC